MSLRAKAFLKQQDRSLAQSSRLHWQDVLSQTVLDMLSKKAAINKTSLKNYLLKLHGESDSFEVNEAIDEAIENIKRA